VTGSARMTSPAVLNRWRQAAKHDFNPLIPDFIPTSCFWFLPFNCIQTNDPANHSSRFTSSSSAVMTHHMHKEEGEDTSNKNRGQISDHISEKKRDADAYNQNSERWLSWRQSVLITNKIFNHPHSSQKGREIKNDDKEADHHLTGPTWRMIERKGMKREAKRGRGKRRCRSRLCCCSYTRVHDTFLSDWFDVSLLTHLTAFDFAFLRWIRQMRGKSHFESSFPKQKDVY